MKVVEEDESSRRWMGVVGNWYFSPVEGGFVRLRVRSCLWQAKLGSWIEYLGAYMKDIRFLWGYRRSNGLSPKVGPQ